MNSKSSKFRRLYAFGGMSLAGVTLLAFSMAGSVAIAQDALYIDSSGNIGIGTNTPQSILDMSAPGPKFRLTNTGAGGGFWDIYVNANTNRLVWTDDPANSRIPFKFYPGAAHNLLRVGVLGSDTIDINGNLVVAGTITPDYVFSPEYEIESIEDHAAFMWREKHLPALSPAQTNENGKGLINVGERSQGLLEELEKAHIYIEQLHSTVTGLTQDNQAQEKVISELRDSTQEQSALIRALEERLATLETTVPRESAR